MSTTMPSSWPLLEVATSATIRIVGLGPGELADLTLAAWQTLSTAPRILARTRRHPCLEELGDRIPIHTCDDLYEQHDEFPDVYKAITERVLALAQEPGGVVYAVPGHPWVGEATTRQISERAAAMGLTVQIIGGVSFIETVYGAVGVDMMDGGQVVDAMLLAQQHHPHVEVGLPLVVGQLYSAQVASDVKLTLMNAYPDTHPVTLVQAAGTARQSTLTRPLYELDHGDGTDYSTDYSTDDPAGNPADTTSNLFDHLTSLYVPPLVHGDFTDLQEIIAYLRAPEGCPWDQEQTFESLRQDLLGEVAEVLEAIDIEADGIDNSSHIGEELGDLLMVATMLVQIATEEGRFKMGDVTRGVVTKLIRRHPHVFGATTVNGVDQLIQNWDEIKKAEKAAKGETAAGPLEGVPTHLPALEKARQLQAKASKAGLLDRAKVAHAQPALSKLLGKSPSADQLGELLWQLVALAHQHKLNAEDSLRSYAVAFREEYSS